MDQFLQELKGRGLEVSVAITDGSPLYKEQPSELLEGCRASAMRVSCYQER